VREALLAEGAGVPGSDENLAAVWVRDIAVGGVAVPGFHHDEVHGLATRKSPLPRQSLPGFPHRQNRNAKPSGDRLRPIHAADLFHLEAEVERERMLTVVARKHA
jgi:hypothetical protein